MFFLPSLTISHCNVSFGAVALLQSLRPAGRRGRRPPPGSQPSGAACRHPSRIRVKFESPAQSTAQAACGPPIRVANLSRASETPRRTRVWLGPGRLRPAPPTGSEPGRPGLSLAGPGPAAAGNPSGRLNRARAMEALALGSGPGAVLVHKFMLRLPGAGPPGRTFMAWVRVARPLRVGRRLWRMWWPPLAVWQ